MNEQPIANLRRNLLDLHGEAGGAWLDALPIQLAQLAAQRGIQVAPPFAALSYNYVAPATLADGTPAILKAGFPGGDMALREVAALQWYAGRGIAQLLCADLPAGIILVERLLPGVMLDSLTDDEQATRIAAQVIRDLVCPAPSAPHPFPSAVGHASQLANLRATFAGGTGPFPQRLVEQAETLFRELLASSGPPMLIHADLHHYNMLSDGAGWRAIDPQGVIAEAEYEIGALLRNPIHRLPNIADLTDLTNRRVAILSEVLGFDRQRIAGWGMAQAVLSAWWSYEDHGEPGSNWLRVAEALGRGEDRKTTRQEEK